MTDREKVRTSILFMAAVFVGAVLAAASFRALSRLDSLRPRILGPSIGNTVWLDSHTYLTTGPSPFSMRLFRVNVRDGARSVCACIPLSRASKSGIQTLSNSPYGAAISPDGTKALWNSTSGWQLIDLATGATRILNADVMDSIRSPRILSPLENAAWMPDSRHWVQVTRTASGLTALTVRDLNGRPISTGAVGHTNASCAILGVLPGNVALLVDGIRLFRVDIDHKFATDFTPYRFPEDDGYLRGVSLSPDKRRLLWIAGQSQPGSCPGCLKCTDTIYISDLNGQNMREKHRYSWTDGPSYLGVGLSRAEWLPDGAGISFVQQNELWTMPADTP